MEAPGELYDEGNDLPVILVGLRVDCQLVLKYLPALSGVCGVVIRCEFDMRLLLSSGCVDTLIS